MINLIKKMKKFLLLLYFTIQITCGNPNDDRNDFEIAREIGGCTQKILIECGNKTPEKCSAICKQILNSKLIYTKEEFDLNDNDIDNISRDLSLIFFKNSRNVSREKLGKRIIEELKKPKTKNYHDLKRICIYYMKWNGLNYTKC